MCLHIAMNTELKHIHSSIYNNSSSNRMRTSPSFRDEPELHSKCSAGPSAIFAFSQETASMDEIDPSEHSLPKQITPLMQAWLRSCNAPGAMSLSTEWASTLQSGEKQQPGTSQPDEETRDSDSPSSVMKFFPFGLDQNMVCPLCKKCFRFEKNLLRHMQNSHATGTGESVLKCKLCSYTTRHYSNMYVHIRTHTGDKPYSCSACGAAFTQGSSLKLHIKSRHNDNTQFFSLTRKPGKNNLTKLWTRVLKKDLPKFNSTMLSSIVMSALSEGLQQQTPTPVFPQQLRQLQLQNEMDTEQHQLRNSTKRCSRQKKAARPEMKTAPPLVPAQITQSQPASSSPGTSASTGENMIFPGFPRIPTPSDMMQSIRHAQYGQAHEYSNPNIRSLLSPDVFVELLRKQTALLPFSAVK